MTYQANIEDWLSLLGVGAEVRGAFAGIVTLKTATDALGEARTRWPGVCLVFFIAECSKN
jgi:hypothetical protein